MLYHKVCVDGDQRVSLAGSKLTRSKRWEPGSLSLQQELTIGEGGTVKKTIAENNGTRPGSLPPETTARRAAGLAPHWRTAR
jgi:hypothetical protein